MLKQDELKEVVDIAIELSTTKDESRLLQKILLTAIRIADCDAGTLYLENNGTFRWFCVFGAAVGMLVVKSTASPFLVKAGARFGLWIKKVISYVAGWLMRPVKYTFRIGKNGFSKIFRGARRSARILKKRLTSRLKLAKIALCKQNRKALRGRKNG